MKLNQNPIVISGVAASPPIPVDTRSNPTNIGLSIVDPGGSTYVVQYSMDDPFAAAGITHWFTAPGTPPTTGTAVYTFTGVLPTAIRVNVTAATTGVTLQAWQSDSTVGA
jgi:hypothetical protein